MAKAQVALEFILLLSFMFLLFVSFFAVIQSKLVDVLENKAKQAVIDQRTVLQNEIQTAAVMEDGFQRTISLPASIYGRAYEIKLQGIKTPAATSELLVAYKEEPTYESYFTLPKNVDSEWITQQDQLQSKPFIPGTDLCFNKIGGKLEINGC